MSYNPGFLGYKVNISLLAEKYSIFPNLWYKSGSVLKNGVNQIRIRAVTFFPHIPHDRNNGQNLRVGCLTYFARSKNFQRANQLPHQPHHNLIWCIFLILIRIYLTIALIIPPPIGAPVLGLFLNFVPKLRHFKA